jgi:cell division protein YceG involved in septum cleavage
VGLPWGPIANVGLDSIQAVVRPARTNYLFFVAQEDGSHVFAETLAEHISNVCALDPTRPECVEVPEEEGAEEESP